MLHVDEQPTRPEQLIGLLVQLPLPVVLQMMNRVARNDEVEGRLPGELSNPRRLSQVGQDEAHFRFAALESVAGLAEHRLREIDQHGLGVGVALQDQGREDAITRAKIDEAPHRLASGGDDPQQHFDLLGGQEPARPYPLEVSPHHLGFLPDAAFWCQPPPPRSCVRLETRPRLCEQKVCVTSSLAGLCGSTLKSRAELRSRARTTVGGPFPWLRRRDPGPVASHKGSPAK